MKCEDDPDLNHHEWHQRWGWDANCGRKRDPKALGDDCPTVKDFIAKGRAAGHDALGIANDPEAIATLDRIKDRKTLQGVIDLLYDVLDQSPLRSEAIAAIERAIERLK